MACGEKTLNFPTILEDFWIRKIYGKKWIKFIKHPTHSNNMTGTINAYYVKGLRASDNDSSPHPNLSSCVEWINNKYSQLNIPYQIKLHDVDTYIRSLSLDELVSIAQKKGTKEELIEYIQTPISFEKSMELVGVTKKDGRWYYEEGKLRPVKLNGIEIDENEYRFKKIFDVRRKRINCYQNTIRREENMNQLRRGLERREISEKSLNDYVAKQMISDFPNYLRLGVDKFCDNQIRIGLDDLTLEKQLNKKLSDLFLIGSDILINNYDRFADIRGFGYFTLGLLDNCAMYVNHIQDSQKRKNEFDKFNRIIKNEFLEGEFGIYGNKARIRSSEGYESETMGYSGLGRLMGNISKEKGSYNYLLVDKFHPHINWSGNQVYYFFRSLYGTDFSATINSINDRKEDDLKFLLVHEFCHLVAKQKDIDGFDTPDDQRLMLAPVYYKDLKGRKIRDESIIEAYQSIIKK